MNYQQFNADFYPTPEHVIERMLQDINLSNKVVFEPSAGKGNIVDYLMSHGAEVIACEVNKDLQKILATKCKIIADDFLTVESHQVSHVDLIVMNPPFSADEKHINHAFKIAPEGCKIVALCNYETIKNTYTRARQELKSVIELYGYTENLGDCFSNSERETGVEIGLVVIQKPGAGSNEFEGFFTDEDPIEDQFNGIMPYNLIRDVVNRYVEAVKIFDEQLASAVKMNTITSGFYSSKLAFNISENEKPKTRSEFKKDLQKAAWTFILKKMNMEKYTTKGLKEDLNRFVEKQYNIPFTMRNIYKMLEIIVGTQSQRMDRAIIEIFDKLTQHYHENRFNVEGWKTNSHYLMGQKFILPYGVDTWEWNLKSNKFKASYGSSDIIDDLVKALCYLKGENYDNQKSLYHFTNDLNCEFGKWYLWSFFEIRGYKKGTIHFKFQNLDDWALLNQNVARIKGYPLFEAKERKAA